MVPNRRLSRITALRAVCPGPARCGGASGSAARRVRRDWSAVGFHGSTARTWHPKRAGGVSFHVKRMCGAWRVPSTSERMADPAERVLCRAIVQGHPRGLADARTGFSFHVKGRGRSHPSFTALRRAAERAAHRDTAARCTIGAEQSVIHRVRRAPKRRSPKDVLLELHWERGSLSPCVREIDVSAELIACAEK